MSEEKKGNEDPNEELKITRKQFQEELQKAHNTGFEIGSSEKYRTLGAFLFSIIEKYAEILKPENASMQQFLKFVVYSMEQHYLEKYEPKEKEDEKGMWQKDDESKEASEG